MRKYRPSSDQPFVYSTWLRNYKHSSYFAKRIKPVVFFAGHHALIAHVLAKPTTQVLIAHPKNDPETILGYLVFEAANETKKPVVHFTFVKEAFRKMGVCKALFESHGINPNEPGMIFTHWCFPVDDLIRKFPEMIFNPYAL